MKFTVVKGAERDHELVADFLAQPAFLSKSQVMWMGRLAIADNAWKGSHSSQMLFIAQPFLCRSKCKVAFVDPLARCDARGRQRFPGR
jgi:hypothetical protein